MKRVLYACPFLTRTNVNSNAAEADKIEITIECWICDKEDAEIEFDTSPTICDVVFLLWTCLNCTMPFCPFWHVFGSFEKKPVIIPPPQMKSNSTVPKPVSPIYIPFWVIEMVTNFVSSMNFNCLALPFFPKMNSVYLSWKKNQEPNNLIIQKDKKYIVPSTDIQKIDEIHSREKFKDFLDYRTLQKLLTVPIYIPWK